MSLSLSLEARIVFLTAAGDAGAGEFGELIARSPDWNRVLALAVFHKAAASLYRAVEIMPASLIPDAVMQQLRRHRMISDFHLMHLRQKLVRSLEVLGDRGIPVMLLKGAALGASVYPSFLERPMADLDLLVHPEHGADAYSALADAGWIAEDHPARDSFYAEHHHMAPLKDVLGTGHSMELHVRAFPSPNPFGDVSAEMWRGAQPTSPEFCGALVPTQAHMAVYACVHFAWSHRMAKGAWRTARDIAELSRRGLDWDEFTGAARRWNAGSSCYWTLRLAETLAGVRAPSSIHTALNPHVSGSVANVLERHLVATAVPGERAPCPSERVAAFMWRAAIRPGPSGHVGDQPADHARMWLSPAENAQAMTELGSGQRNRVREWLDYFDSVFSASERGLRNAH